MIGNVGYEVSIRTKNDVQVSTRSRLESNKEHFSRKDARELGRWSSDNIKCLDEVRLRCVQEWEYFLTGLSYRLRFLAKKKIKQMNL